MAKVKQIINIETNFKFIYVIRDCKMGFMEIDAPPILFYLLMDNNRVYIWGPSSLDDGTPKIGERLEDISSFLVTRITKEMVVEELEDGSAVAHVEDLSSDISFGGEVLFQNDGTDSYVNDQIITAPKGKVEQIGK